MAGKERVEFPDASPGTVIDTSSVFRDSAYATAPKEQTLLDPFAKAPKQETGFTPSSEAISIGLLIFVAIVWYVSFRDTPRR